MTTFFGVDYQDFSGNHGKMTLSSGPVIISSQNKVLVHLSSTTKKYQFIGGRLDDTLSMKENALKTAGEVMDSSNIILENLNPLILCDEISRDDSPEKLLLIHYKAQLKDENKIGTGEWKTLEEIEKLSSENMLSSPNILIAIHHFLGK